jgi:Protein of unknown function (DUF3574)
MNWVRQTFACIALALLVNNGSAESISPQRSFPAVSERAFCKHVLHGELFARTELFFGLSRPGGVVTEGEFQAFVDNRITPRFPDGLTLLSGKGQFRDSTNVIIQEGTKLLILLYPFSKARSADVEQIRTDYKEAFQQQSVLRVDEQSCVSF